MSSVLLALAALSAHTAAPHAAVRQSAGWLRDAAAATCPGRPKPADIDYAAKVSGLSRADAEMLKAMCYIYLTGVIDGRKDAVDTMEQYMGRR